MVNQQMMQNMMWAVLVQQYEQLPDRAKQALSHLEVKMAKYPDRLVVLVKSESQSEDVSKAGALLINQLYQFLPEYLNKSFMVKVSKYVY